MTRKFTILVAVCGLLFGQAAWAHRIDEYLQATILSLEAGEARASMRLIPGVLVAPSVIAGIDTNRDGVFSADEQQAYTRRVLSDLSVTLDGKRVPPRLLSWSCPQPAQMREGLGEIRIEYRIELPPGGLDRALILENRHLASASVYLMNAVIPKDPSIRLTAQKRSESQSSYELDYRQSSVVGAASRSQSGSFRSWLSGVPFASLFRLGARHIAEGTDHLLFLLVLLLPAPLLAAGSRWDRPAGIRQSLLRILGIVTAFTLGHSITLGLAAMDVVRAPERPIEVLIAASILVSAVHTLRPIFPGREAWIAGFFGLIHGLAFAAALGRLGLARWDRLAGILAFNLGIESMQILVVALLLPSLMLMSRTRAYPAVRVCGAVFASAASVGWIAERLFDRHTPVDAVVSALARHALWGAAALLLASLACSSSWSPYARSGSGSSLRPSTSTPAHREAGP